MVWDESGPGGGQAKHTRRLPVETTLVQEAHSKACEVCECDRSCLGAGGWTWSRPGSRRSAPSPVARAVHGEIVHHAGGHTSSSQTPRTCSGCRARSCSHQGSAGLITCLECWMRCSLPPICIWVPSLPPPPLFRPEASSSSPSRILLAWPQGVAAEKGGNAGCEVVDSGLGHPSSPSQNSSRSNRQRRFGGRCNPSTPHQASRQLRAGVGSVNDHSKRATSGKWALQPAARCMV